MLVHAVELAAALYLLSLAAVIAWRAVRGRAECFRVRYLGREDGQHCVLVKSTSKKRDVWLCRGDSKQWVDAITGKPLPCWLARVVYRYMLRRDKDLSELPPVDVHAEVVLR